MITFIEESEELLENLEQNLLRLEGSPGDKELINETFRLMHTIKGSSGLVACNNITDFAHQAEDLLDQVRDDSLQVNNEIIDILFLSHDVIKDMLASLISEGHQMDLERINSTKEQIERLINNNVTVSDDLINTKHNQQENVYRIIVEFNNELFRTGTDPLLLLREIKGLGEVLEIDIVLSRIPDFFEIDPEQCYLTIEETISTNLSLAELRDVFVFVEIDSMVKIEDLTKNYQGNKAKISAGQRTSNTLNKKARVINQGDNKTIQEKSTIKVSTDKLELLMNSVAELVISQARVKERISQRDLNEDQQLGAALEEVDKKIHYLQEEVMKSRMVPIGNTFLRFRRLVRDLSQEQNKKIKLIIKGRETELDKTIIEKIADPLKHMLRNAVDHGIELPEERVALDKPAVGTITLDAYHQEGNIIIEIADDGRGLDKKKIRKSALKKGLIRNDFSSSEEDIYNLIFEAGLSTSEKITETSGRGVGMDVVRSNIEALRGHITINTAKDKGTSYKIKLPLTLAIIDGMSIVVGNENFIIPINSIIEFYQPSAEEIKSVAGSGESVCIRGEYLNFFRLSKLFNIENKVLDPTKGILVILKDDRKKVCLLVDKILGQQQAVVKSLEDNYVNVPGLAGATILGNGKVAMIIDVSSLMKVAFK